MKNYILIILLCSSTLLADDLSVRTGLGQDSGTGKILSLNYSRPLSKEIKFLKKFDFLKADFEFGGYNPINFLTSDYTMFGSIGLGFEVKTHGMYAKFSQGVGFISETGWRLNTLYQFPTTLSGGLYRDNGAIGIFYKHFSNGSGSRYNKGANYLGMELSLNFW